MLKFNSSFIIINFFPGFSNYKLTYLKMIKYKKVIKYTYKLILLTYYNFILIIKIINS